MTAEIVEDHNIALLQSGNEFVFNIKQKALAVDRTVEDEWRVNTIMPQRREESHGLPMAVRNLGGEPFAQCAPTSQRGHVGFGPGLINKDKTARIKPALILLPTRSVTSNVRTILFAWQDTFF